jgi:hypothetical protein
MWLSADTRTEQMYMQNDTFSIFPRLTNHAKEYRHRFLSGNFKFLEIFLSYLIQHAVGKEWTEIQEECLWDDREELRMFYHRMTLKWMSMGTLDDALL